MLRIIISTLIWSYAWHLQAQPQALPSKHFNDFTVALSPSAKDALLNVFPNPMTDVLNIYLAALHPDTVHHAYIMGISGEQVLQTRLHSTLTSLDLSHLPEGWYVVYLQVGTQRISKRIFKMTGP